jgi:hypothetical protein
MFVGKFSVSVTLEKVPVVSIVVDMTKTFSIDVKEKVESGSSQIKMPAEQPREILISIQLKADEFS